MRYDPRERSFPIADLDPSSRWRDKWFPGLEPPALPAPYVRIELLICTMLTETWAPDAWPVVKHELAKAFNLRRHIARAGWWN